ncbi:GNAT family N-acetyltransferase [Rhodobacteraceae bacterium NNCM2]|nr:GNAT family N-acetyltransferase [Coraliihabitans acroporae]
MTLTIRPATEADHDAIWQILEPTFRAGETYCVDRDVTREGALAYWLAPENRVFVADEGGVLGTYLLHANQRGGGAHVSNCGFATSPSATGRGIAQAMLSHALDTAREAGFRAMQFNFVVSTNTRAVALWERNGFETVGRLPGAFDHPTLGEVDALVMYRRLT